MTKAATTKKYPTHDKAPSEMFIDALIRSSHGHGSEWQECDYCGRTHMCPTSEYASEDFEENCVAMQKENPEGVILHWEYDGVSAVNFNGMNFVLNCPCNGLGKYEAFIWAERNAIRQYLKDRIDHEHELAEQEKTLNKMAGFNVAITARGTWNENWE